MPIWCVTAAGHIPDRDPGAAADLRDRLAAVLSDPRWQTALSSFHADGTEPVRTVLHLGADVAACA